MGSGRDGKAIPENGGGNKTIAECNGIPDYIGKPQPGFEPGWVDRRNQAVYDRGGIWNGYYHAGGPGVAAPGVKRSSRV